MSFVADPSDEPVGRVERRHPGAGAVDWCERYDFEAHSPLATFGLHVTVVRWPAANRTWYWSAVVEEGQPLASIVELDAGSGRPTLELRTGGLWADHNLESAFEHWSVGLEAFAVGLDDPTEVFGAFRGDRVPLGYDVEWEMSATDGEALPGGDGYLQPAEVHGEVLMGTTAYELAGKGSRTHSWGAWPLAGVHWRGVGGDGGFVTSWDGVPPTLALWPTDGLPSLIESPWGPVEIIGWSPARLAVPGGATYDVVRGMWRSTGAGDAAVAAGSPSVGWVELTRSRG